MEDPEAHLTAFHTQMMLVGGSDAVRWKLFMSTLTGVAMDWFIILPEGHITSFAQLSQLFREQYLANRAPPPVSYDLFDVKQYQGETLKKYINRFGAQVVKVGTTEEPMIVYAFRKRVYPGPYANQSSATAQKLSMRSGIARRNTSPLRVKCTRNEQVLRLRAQECRRVRNPPGSMRPRQEGRARKGDAPTRGGGPSPGVEQKETGQRGKEIHR